MPELRRNRSRGRKAARGAHRRRIGVPVFFAVCLLPFGALPAAADPSTPSARDVQESKEEARERAAEVGRVQARLAEADGRLRELRAEVEKLVERYHGERVELRRARDANQDAERRLTKATKTVQETRDEVATLAAQRYRMRGGLTEVSAMVAGDGGVAGFVDRMSTVQSLAHERRAALDRMRAAEIVADILRSQAHDAMVAQREATERVAAAKKTAEAAVAEQLDKIEAIKKEKKRLRAALGDARETLRDLERARARAARRSAGAASSELSYGGGGGGAAARKGEIAARAALRWLGTPYSWGGGTARGPSYGIAHGSGIYGFDCSGLTKYAWAQAGVYLDHWTGTQWTSGPHVPLDRLRRGDLVFFGQITSNPGDIHHVGLYIGDGRMVEAPYTGASVRISTIWRSDLVGATRPSG